MQFVFNLQKKLMPFVYNCRNRLCNLYFIAKTTYAICIQLQKLLMQFIFNCKYCVWHLYLIAETADAIVFIAETAYGICI